MQLDSPALTYPPGFLHNYRLGRRPARIAFVTKQQGLEADLVIGDGKHITLDKFTSTQDHTGALAGARAQSQCRSL